MRRFVLALAATVLVVAGCTSSPSPELTASSVNVAVVGSTGVGWLLSRADDVDAEWVMDLHGDGDYTLSVALDGTGLTGAEQIVWRPRWMAQGPFSVATLNGEWQIVDGRVESSATFVLTVDWCATSGESVTVPLAFDFFEEDTLAAQPSVSVPLSVTVDCDESEVAK